MLGFHPRQKGFYRSIPVKLIGIWNKQRANAIIWEEKINKEHENNQQPKSNNKKNTNNINKNK